MKDLTGQRFGRLVVKRPTEQRGPDGGIVYECVCDCGNVCFVWNNKLLRKNHSAKRSCGCLQQETHKTLIHGDSGTILFHKWRGMKERCNNPNSKSYKYYGGRGISVCDEWNRDYSLFKEWAVKAGYREGLSIDRVDVNKGYSPDNCRWVEIEEQQSNKTSNIEVEINGEKKILAEWARCYGVPYGTVWARIRKYGWDVIEALNVPVGSRKRYLHSK